jgi:hypothetical protein
MRPTLPLPDRSTYKTVRSSNGNTNGEVDYTSWAYSMQAYAPGASDRIDITYIGEDHVWWYGICTATCTWQN